MTLPNLTRVLDFPLWGHVTCKMEVHLASPKTNELQLDFPASIFPTLELDSPMRHVGEATKGIVMCSRRVGIPRGFWSPRPSHYKSGPMVVVPIEL